MSINVKRIGRIAKDQQLIGYDFLDQYGVNSNDGFQDVSDHSTVYNSGLIK